jgi:tripartite-type tricarboxylate transporter receptor subunit TctC
MNRLPAKSRALWRALIGGAAAVAALSAPLAQAQNAGAYPTKPIRLVIPFAPGGSTDILGRLLAQKMGLYTKLPYDPLRDFAPVSLVGRSPLVLTVGENSPLRSLADLTAAAQAAPGKLNYPSSGTGGPNHLGAELYAMQAKVKVSHIPYKGSAPSVVSLVAGETDFGFLTAVTIASQLNAGKVRALAVAHTERLPSMPNVPTMTEAGLKGFTADAWFLAAVPVGTPQPIVDRLYAEIAKALPAPEVKAKLDSVGVLPSGLDPQASAKFLRTEVDKWRGVIKTAGITLD